MPERRGRECLPHRAHRRSHLVRQRRAVGVAHRQGLGARLQRRGQTGHRVGGVIEEPVEEVLGVVDDPLAGGDEERDGLRDHPQVLVAIDPHDLLQVQAPGLADDRRDRRPGLRQHPQGGVLFGGDSPAARHPERTNIRSQSRFAQPLEELELLRVRGREARLDHRHAELVEDPRDADLLLDRERHALPLHAVAQGGVVDDDLAHETAAGTLSSQSA